MLFGIKMTSALLGVALWGLPAGAQIPNLVRVMRVTVKPDRVGEYMEIQKAYSAAYKKANTWRTVSVAVYGSTNEYVITAPLDSYATLDGPNPLTKGGMTEAETARLAARLAQCTESTRVTIEKPSPEASVTTTGAPMPKFYRVVRVRTRPGMADQYVNALASEISPVLKKAGLSGFRVRRVEYGGSRNDITVSTAMQSMSDLDSGGMVAKALGPENLKKLLEKTNALISNSEYVILRYLPDLSNPPQ